MVASNVANAVNVTNVVNVANVANVIITISENMTHHQIFLW